MKQKQFFITMLCICTFLTLTACGKSESFTLKESQSPAPTATTTTPTPIVSASASPTPTPTPSTSDDAEIVYIGNKATKIFHLPACSTLPNKKNRTNLYTKESALKSGYKPCKNCNP